MRLEGVFTALVTPFADDRLDEASLHARIAEQRAAGVSGLVVAATTGEGTALEPAEWRRLLEISIAEKGGLLIIANTGTNNTAHSVTKTLLARDLGADAAMVVTPYYNKPTQAGMLCHFGAIANASSLPLVIYNIPSRTGCELLPDTCRELLAYPTIVGIKQAATNLDRISEIRLAVGRQWSLLSGEDAQFLPTLALGGDGIVSASANVVPEHFVGIYNAVRSGDWDEARRLHFAAYELIRMLFIETSPAPLKEAMKMRGRPCGEVRPPLAPLSEHHRDALRAALHKALEAI